MQIDRRDRPQRSGVREDEEPEVRIARITRFHPRYSMYQVQDIFGGIIQQCQFDLQEWIVTAFIKLQHDCTVYMKAVDIRTIRRIIETFHGMPAFSDQLICIVVEPGKRGEGRRGYLYDFQR